MAGRRGPDSCCCDGVGLAAAGDGNFAAGSNAGLLLAFDVLLLLLYVASLLHAVVAVAARYSIRWDSWVCPGRWPGPYVAVVTAAMLTYTVWSGVVVWLARWLSPDDKAMYQPGSDIGYPPVFVALAQWSVLLIASVVAITGLVAAVSFWRRRSASAGDLIWETAAWQATSPSERPQAPSYLAWRARVCNARWFADIRRWIEFGLGLTTLGATCGVLYVSYVYTVYWLGSDGAFRLGAALAALCVALTVVARAAAVRDRPPQPASMNSEPSIGRRFRLPLGVTGAAVLLVSVIVIGVWINVSLRQLPTRPPTPSVPTWLASVVNEGLASSILTALPIVCVIFLQRAIRQPTTRRTVGAIWDVTTFWPRAFHPLAPPSYAERAVPELIIRVRGLLNRGHRVILLGHSQGAVLVAAVAAQLASLTESARNRLSVITYGNPIAPLYMRWFPVYMNEHAIAAAQAAHAGERGLRWINFFRRTDPIGRELFTQRTGSPPITTDPRATDYWLADPPIDHHQIGDGPPRIRGHAHAGYLRQSGLARHLQHEAERLLE